MYFNASKARVWLLHINGLQPIMLVNISKWLKFFVFLSFEWHWNFRVSAILFWKAESAFRRVKVCRNIGYDSLLWCMNFVFLTVFWCRNWQMSC